MRTNPALVTDALARAEKQGFLRSCEEETGRILAVLAASLPPGARVFEMGTGAGVGLAWIVHGLGSRRDVDVVTVERDVARWEAGQPVNWPVWVTRHRGDALDVLDAYDGFDLIFADAPHGKWKGLDRTIDALRPGGFLFMDDIAAEGDEARRGNARVLRTLRSRDDLVSADLVFGTWMVLAVRRR
jgi:predicted O-methyltransferase YrrM